MLVIKAVFCWKKSKLFFLQFRNRNKTFRQFVAEVPVAAGEGEAAGRKDGRRAQESIFTKLHFGQKVFRQILSSNFGQISTRKQPISI
jgi:hypothetical protein